MKSGLYIRSFIRENGSTTESLSKMERLSKMVAGTGLCSRRDAERWIMQGRVMVNGEADTSVTQFVSSKDVVYVDGMKIRSGASYSKPKLWMVNKLAGELVAEKDPQKNRPLLYDRIKAYVPNISSIKPVFRLEFNTEGLLLLTDNGELAKLLCDPSQGLIRHYRAKIHGLITASKLEGFRRGPVVNGLRYSGMSATIQHKSGTQTWMALSCPDSKSRAVKTVCEHLHLTLTRLICVGFGPYKLNDLPAGNIVEAKLTPELEELFNKRQLSRPGRSLLRVAMPVVLP